MNHPEGEQQASTILLDMRAAQLHGGRGIGTYSQSLALQICKDFPQHQYLLLYDSRLPPCTHAEELGQHGHWQGESALSRMVTARISTLITMGFFIPLHGRGGEYLLPAWLEPHQPHKLGVVYDLIPYLYPQQYLRSREERESYLAALRVMRSYERLFAISRATRRDTIRHVGVSPGRIQCIEGGIDQRKQQIINSAPCVGTAKRHPIRKAYCVYVGGDDWRKNMAGMVKAFARFHHEHPSHQLVIICAMSPQRWAHYEQLSRELGIPQDSLVCTGNVADDDLIGLVREAEMMVFPSFYEGLGLPILEAYACGVPVIASKTSSMEELVIPELACDPLRPEDIALKMRALQNAPDLRGKSLAFGRCLLLGRDWKQAAAATVAHLCKQLPHAETDVTGLPIAVVGALPPATTGIAPYTLRYLQSRNWTTHFFDANPGSHICDTKKLLPGNRMLPVEILHAALDTHQYSTIIFVLGNSPHHKKVLSALMQTRINSRCRRLAYLHEANLEALLKTFLDKRWENQNTVDCDTPWIQRAFKHFPAMQAGLIFLFEVAALDGLIVNSESCRDLVRAALGTKAEEWTIDVVMLPIEIDISCLAQPAKQQSDATLHIGCFGIPNAFKRLDLVVSAVKLLARKRRVKLIFAGWDVKRACRQLRVDALPFIEVHDSPKDDALYKLMKRIDVSVQLRMSTQGESSGVVSHLYALGKQVIVMNEGSFSDSPPEIATFVQPSCDPQSLADAIELAAARPTLEPAALQSVLEPWSPETFESKLARILRIQASLV